MKKTFLVCLCICVVFALAGCSKGKTSITTALSPEAFKAEITVIEAPAEVKINSSFSAKLSVKNASSVVWPALGNKDGSCFIHLGNHWADESGKILVNDDGRTALARDLEPGNSVEMKLTMKAPAQKGSYVIQYDMVQEAVSWFADKKSKKAETKIRVIE